MSERDIQEINERIIILREQLEGKLMSAEKEYKIRFEISDLQYESLQKQIDDLKKGSKSQKMTNSHSNFRNTTPIRADNDIREIQKKIDKLEMDQVNCVMNTDKERELIEEIKLLKRQISDIEKQKTQPNNRSGGLLGNLKTIMVGGYDCRELSNVEIQHAIDFRENIISNKAFPPENKQKLIEEINQLKRELEKRTI